MTAFSATDAALEGFRITRERPKALLACSGFILAVSVLGMFLDVFMPSEARKALEAVQSNQPMEPGPFLEALVILSPQMLFGLLVMSITVTAIYRILLGTEQGWLGYFRVGAAEFRLVALTLIYIVLFVFMVAGATLFAVVVSALVQPLGEGAILIFGTVAWLFAWGVIVFVTVRMSLAPVITFERNRLAIMDSWPLTRGHFWHLTGAYVLAIACSMVVAVLAMLIFLPMAGIALILTGGKLSDVTEILNPAAPTFAAYLEPIRVAYLVLSALCQALWFAVIAAPGAYAYRALTGGAPPPPAEA